MSRRKADASRFDPPLSRGIIAIILVVTAIIITLSFFDKAGVIGVMLNDYVLSALFGSIRFATPVVILILTWFLIKDYEISYRKTHGLGAFLFFLSLSSIMHMPFDPSDMWMEALAGHGGGVFGMLAWPLKSYVGTIGSYVILIGLACISVFLIFNTAVTAFILFHKKLFVGLGAVGQWILLAVKKLFVKSSGVAQVRIKGEYDEAEDDEKTIEEDEETDEEQADEPESKKRIFAAKTIGEKNSEEDEDEEKETEKPAKSDIWSKRVIIKNLPPYSLLSDKRSKPTSGDIEANAEIIHSTFGEFGIEVDMGEVRVGPTVTQYSLKPSAGVRLTRITGLSNDLALALAAHPIRIEAPIPGKSLVGIEVPNQKTAMVSLKELLESKEFTHRAHNLMIALGKDVAGKVWFADLPRMPHLLIAGATGSGKTVCVNTIIMSLLYQNTAETLRFIMIDPKRVELTLYNGIPHLLTPVITNVHKTVNALKWAIGEMERRFEVLSQDGSRDVPSYNTKHPDHKIPSIVIVIDELADLMATAASEVEAGIIRLAQMARAVSIHLILATQRPSVDVITGLMKANIPARIAFSVASIIDSRTILDCPGAEKLLGRGDMLLLTAELSKPVRIQGAFVSEDELKGVAEYLQGDETPEYDESITEHQKSNGGTMNLFGGASDDQDPLFEEAKAEIIKTTKASASFLQRRFKIGYARAARVLDELEEAGVIGPSNGAKPREILVTETEIHDTMDAGGDLNAFDEPEKEQEIEEESEEEEITEEQDEETTEDEIVEEEEKNSSNF
jgi:S-DNA-T family DNA segregation ATPase FtsK/SpoIIIE